MFKLPRLIVASGLALGMLGLYSGCGITSRRAEITVWIGRTERELIAAKGNPDHLEYDSAGHRVLVYDWTWEDTTQDEGRSYTDSSGVTHWTNPTTRTRTHREIRKYVIDKSGQVIDGSWHMY